MRANNGTVFSLSMLGVFAASLASSLTVTATDHEQRQRHREHGWNPSVGRNAPEAIASGLAEMNAGWADTMARFYANPHIDNEGYFDYYRRPDYGWSRAERRR